MCLDDQATFASAKALADEGYKVYVIGYNVDTQWAPTMTGIAENGGTSDYYSVEDPDSFTQVLQGIVDGLVKCQYSVDWSSLSDDISESEDNVHVHCKADPSDPADDSNELDYNQDCANGAAGWTWLDHENFELCEESCDLIKSGECKEVVATFECLILN